MNAHERAISTVFTYTNGVRKVRAVFDECSSPEVMVQAIEEAIREAQSEMMAEVKPVAYVNTSCGTTMVVEGVVSLSPLNLNSSVVVFRVGGGLGVMAYDDFLVRVRDGKYRYAGPH